MPTTFTILGECASGKNSRQIVVNRGTGRPMLIKSAKARAFEAAVKAQAPRLAEPLEGRLRVTATLFYASQRPDLDATVLLDALQGIVYKNDRQCREIHLYHDIDKERPRVEVTVECAELVGK